MKVSNFNELLAALAMKEDKIEVVRSFMATHSVILPPKTHVGGIAQENGKLPIIMFEHSDGFGLTADNQIHDLIIQTPVTHKAIFNAGTQEDLGTFEFSNLKVTGQFSFIMRNGSRNANIKIDNLHVLSADTRGYLEQPQKYGVNVLQGALTIYNFNPDASSLIRLQAKNISIGTEFNPVTGSGLFVGGFGDNGGKVEAEEIQTDTIYSTGRIPYGVADIITGAVFIVNSAHVKQLTHKGPTVTYGVNDMVLDAWGQVDNWLVEAPVISYGPSGVGFVNFGLVKNFVAKSAIETYGQGARGYNQYDGTLEEGQFDSIRTYGDGSIGIQVSKRVGSIHINGDVTTQGSIGNSLVKGVNVNLPAYALSVKDGGEINNFTLKGKMSTAGDKVTALYVEDGGKIQQLDLSTVPQATGTNSKSHEFLEGSYIGNLEQVKEFLS
ncbi:hypothetical protein [Facklamia sp. 7083-14-GEN3]|uniref:hypothetical protein n=1 Tax=Facklamia sp. 7083-14-GEN3 TaxID=2973478 RepID=UPI00215D23D9|nr:hypothetical protein [Facklamia sp. 7083-14-GEN3]MCR8968414.1 hypothetical protein [Facklamia sp. 7083-14-GEN3]